MRRWGQRCRRRIAIASVMKPRARRDACDPRKAIPGKRRRKHSGADFLMRRVLTLECGVKFEITVFDKESPPARCDCAG